MEQLTATTLTVPLSTPPSYEAGPTLPHSTLVHVLVTECSTATDTHAAGAQDGSQLALTAGPNPTHVDPTQHTNTSSGLRLQCALMRGARVQDSTTAVISCWQRGQREQFQTQFAPRLSHLQWIPSLDPARVLHLSPPPSSQRPSLTRWPRESRAVTAPDSLATTERARPSRSHWARAGSMSRCTRPKERDWSNEPRLFSIIQMAAT